MKAHSLRRTTQRDIPRESLGFAAAVKCPSRTIGGSSGGFCGSCCVTVLGVSQLMLWDGELSDVIKRVTSVQDLGKCVDVLRLDSGKASSLQCGIAE